MSPSAAGGTRTWALMAIGGASLMILLLALPFLALLFRVSWIEILRRLAQADVLDALRLSIVSTVAATTIVAALGTPLAYLLETRSFPGRRAIEVLVQLPMVLPPTVAGFALLLAFGRAGLLGRPLAILGLTIPFTTSAVVLAQVFMSAPFFLSAARAGFASVDRGLVQVASTLRAGETFTFFRVVLPLARPALLAGLAMAAARALGEFGATITFAGNLPGTTRTMPLAVYVALQSDLDTAVVLSAILLMLSVALLAALRWAPVSTLWSPARVRTARPSGAR